MGWWIALGIVVLLAVLPLGVSVKYDSQGLLAKVIAGPARITVFPLSTRKKKENKKETAAKQETKNNVPAEKEPKPPQPPKQDKKQKPKEENGGSFLDFLPLVKVALDFLGDFRRKLRLDNLELKLIMAADDPCDLAVNYGRAWAALGNLMPQLEKLFVIKKRNIEIECDFTTSETLVIARLDLTITLGRILSLVFVYAIRAFMEFLKIKKTRKEKAVQLHESEAP